MLLADENVNNNLLISMRKAGYNVFSIREMMPSIDDEKITELSLQSPRIIISQDKDFGELVIIKILK